MPYVTVFNIIGKKLPDSTNLLIILIHSSHIIGTILGVAPLNSGNPQIKISRT